MAVATNQELEDRLNAMDRRVTNLEERVRDLFAAHTKFASSLEIQEMLAILQTDNKAVETLVSSLNKRVEILEDLPDVN